MIYNSPIHELHHLSKKIIVHSYALLGKNLCDSLAVVWKETPR